MSKYILTNKNIVKNISKFNENEDCYWIYENPFMSRQTFKIYKKDIVRESDTIEGLLDYIVAVKKDDHIPAGFFPVDDVMGNEEDYHDIIEDGYNCFGAVWTDKGLLYVTKINENKEWETL